MTRAHREGANELIKRCTLEDGTLDLTMLRGFIRTKATELTDHQKKSAVAVYTQTIRDYERDLNTAVREVLGVIPREQWDRSDATVWERNFPKYAPYQEKEPDHGLVIKASPKTFDPKKSMEEQGFVFAKPEVEIATGKSSAKDSDHHAKPPHHGLNDTVKGKPKQAPGQWSSSAPVTR